MAEPKQPAVSVLCNTYNHEKYIRDALEGFVSQKTDFPFEVLVHDDASTDSTAEIIREYEKNYPELIKPIYQTENQYSKHDGTISRLQGGRAKGKYIAVCEGDDYWTDPLKLQKQYDFMEAHPEYSLCACSVDWLNMLTGKVENKGRVAEDTDLSLEDIILEKKGRIFVFVSLFMKAEVWKNRHFWGFPIGDYPLAVDAALAGKVHMMKDVMCVYRWYAPGSWTSNTDTSRQRAEVNEKMIAALKEMDRSTGYKYTDLISQRILRHKYTLALMRRDLAAIKSEELIGIYRKKDLFHRCSDVLRCKAPGLHRLLRKAAGKTNREE